MSKKKRMARMAAQDQATGGQTDDRQGRDWADDAANARTADDPRARTPHDRDGVPSTGNTTR